MDLNGIPYLTEIITFIVGGGIVKLFDLLVNYRRVEIEDRKTEDSGRLSDAQAIQQITLAATQAVELLQEQVTWQGNEIKQLRITLAQQDTLIYDLKRLVGEHQIMIGALEKKEAHYRTGVVLLTKQVLELGQGQVQPVFVIKEREDSHVVRRPTEFTGPNAD
jgi:hypothetical protein